MNHEQQLKLQAYLDGEVSDREARQISDLLSRDSEARAIFEELQFTKTALVENEPEMKLPETREFFWSKIERDIRNLETTPRREVEPVSIFRWLNRILVPAASLAVVAMLGIVMINKSAQSPTVGAVEFEEVESEEMGAFTFRSQSERMTVVWLYSRNNSDVVNSSPSFNPYE